MTVYRWVQRFTPLLAEAGRPCRHRVGDRCKSRDVCEGRWSVAIRLRAIDQFGQVIDVFVSARRDTMAPTGFPAGHRHDEVGLWRSSPPGSDISDGARGVLPVAWHRTEQYANNRVEADHGRLKARLRPMRGLKQDPRQGVIAGMPSSRTSGEDTTSWPPRSSEPPRGDRRRRARVAIDPKVYGLQHAAVVQRTDPATSGGSGPGRGAATTIPSFGPAQQNGRDNHHRHQHHRQVGKSVRSFTMMFMPYTDDNAVIGKVRTRSGRGVQRRSSPWCRSGLVETRSPPAGSGSGRRPPR